MLSPQTDGPGQRLGLDDYSEDFGRHFWRSGSEGLWKLERQQTFQAAKRVISASIHYPPSIRPE